ncbi:MAG: class I SAM-dependent methyltransferase [Lachnospiraceae bacterium]|nr:class I SAM-dependent methyltransferase [Lachnospiraceae bacterium]
MLSRIQLPSGAVCLDLGAGDGETVHVLRELGYQALGIDQLPGGDPVVRQGDFLDLQMDSECVDLCISQCAFFVSGNPGKALQEAWRVLKQGGFLLLADLDPGDLEQLAVRAGYTVLERQDITKLWQQYYIESIWNDTLCCREYGSLIEKCRGKKLRYTVLILGKGENDGSI